MKLEIGMTYVDQSGRLIGPLQTFTNGNGEKEVLYPFYTENGKERYTTSGAHCSKSPRYNLVREVNPTDYATVTAVGYEVMPKLDEEPKIERVAVELDPEAPSNLKPAEAVMHPAHYGGKDDPYETIKVMKARLTREELIGALKFNIYKYNDRAGKKGAALVDHQKAQFYQNELVNVLSDGPGS